MKSWTTPRSMLPGESHPARGGWIEIKTIQDANIAAAVPPRTGWVD